MFEKTASSIARGLTSFVRRFLARAYRPQIQAPLVLAVGLFLVNAPLILLPNSLFWDDWTFFTGGSFVPIAHELGRPWTGSALDLLARSGPYAFKIVSYVAIYLGGLCIVGILLQWPGLRPAEATVGGLVYIVAPVAFSRVTASILTFQISTTIFLIAWLLWVVSASTRRHNELWLRAVSYCLFFFSMITTGSLLVFFALPAAHVYLLVRSNGQKRLGQSLVAVFKREWGFLVLPVVAFFVTSSFFVPYGEYSGYNHISLPTIESDNFLRLGGFLSVVLVAGIVLLLAPWTRVGIRIGLAAEIGTVVIVALIFWEISDFRDRAYRVWQIRELDELANLTFPAVLLAIGAILVAAQSALARYRRNQVFPWSPRFKTSVASPILFGVFGLALGMVPYLLVGKPPHPAAFADRLELLLPVGIAFIVSGLAYVLRSFGPGFLPQLPIKILVMVMSLVTLFQYSLMAVDWSKQTLVIDSLVRNPGLSSSSTIVFQDETRHLNWDNRGNPLYEITGWVYTAYGHKGILGVSHETYASYLQRGILENTTVQARSGFAPWSPDGPVSTVVITSNSPRLSLLFGEGEINLDLTVLR